MARPELGKRIEDLDKKSNEEILSFIAELTAECEEKRKSCAKLHEEVQLIQNNLQERSAARSAEIVQYSETLDLLPLAEKANSAKQRVEELEMEIKDKEERVHRRRAMEEDVRALQKERVRLEANYSALVENMTNVKSQVESLAKSRPEQSSRPLTRREADEQLDDLVKLYLPNRLFKSRRQDDQ